LVNPVPVRATVVPIGAPAARPLGEAEVIVGPATLKALLSEAEAVAFSKSAVWAPATVLDAAATLQVRLVPPEATHPDMVA